MNATQHYLAALAPGMDIIAGAAGPLDGPDAVVAELRRLHAVYFGRVKHSRLQREAVAASRRAGHSLAALQVIEKHARRLPTEDLRWALRSQLCALQASPDALDKHAARLRRELAQPTPRRESVNIYRRATGPWTLSITARSSLIADLHAAIVAAENDPAVLLRGAGRKQLRTNVVIQLDELVRITRGDTDVILQRTDGARITGSELVTQLMASVGLFTLVHPVEGPVELYRSQRGASAKQREMLMAIHPTCAKPGCNQPAEHCHIHHIWAWTQGGYTNIANLVPLCAYDNGRNDDDPRVHRNGRIERRGGQIVFTPPWADYLTEPLPGQA